MILGQSDSSQGSDAVLSTPSPCVEPCDFEAVVDRQHGIVYRYAYRLTGCSSSAEDIAQDVFLKAFRHIHQLRDPSAERSWLLAITRNEFARWLRKNAGRVTADNIEQPASARSDRPTPQAQLETADWVQAALSELSDEYRMVVLMHYYEDLSYSEISEKLQIPIGTVMSRLSRGRNHLRRHLGELAIPN